MIDAEKLAEVKARYPSCARDWDVSMVEKAWPRLSTLLPQRLNRVDTAVLSDATRKCYGVTNEPLPAPEPVPAPIPPVGG